jgi:LPXTG-site transpeptidase (sortase) family protein
MSTTLSAQPAAKAYADEAMWLEIPSLGVKEPVVGVPRTDGDWDVSWLGRQVGWLDGTSFPTWAGNTVLAGHSYDALGKPGPFVHLGSMQWGDWVIVHAWGQEYVYSVRTNNLVDPADATLLTKHEDTPWITLVTCQGYNEHTGQYKYRSIVRAVLIKVQSEP